MLFRRFALLTYVAVLLLILVGGVVRATGSGMGCPDWPKCFGLWIPPTDISQLPVDYSERFGAKLKGEVIFNPIKTWIEYLNRLLGVLVGLFSIITLVLGFVYYYKKQKSTFFIVLLGFLLIIIEGWLGSKVVSTELNPGLISLHMVLAIFIMGLYLWSVIKTYKLENLLSGFSSNNSLSFLVILLFVFSLGQLILGTQIREGIDYAEHSLKLTQRADWVATQRGKITFHGSFSLVILFIGISIYLKGRFLTNSIKKWSLGLLLFIAISILTGISLGYFGLPAFLQPIHLLLSACILSILIILFFYFKPEWI
jgi:heme a synthase